MGAGRELYVELISEQLDDQDLDDIIGLFHRYNIDMKPLSRFLTNENKKWFYENKKVFGNYGQKELKNKKQT